MRGEEEGEERIGGERRGGKRRREHLRVTFCHTVFLRSLSDGINKSLGQKFFSLQDNPFSQSLTRTSSCLVGLTVKVYQQVALEFLFHPK